MTIPSVPDVRQLLGPDQFAEVTATVVNNNPGMGEATAQRIVTEALAFVATAAGNPATCIAPSRTVEEGWHALILHTALYAGLCDRLGMFVHHYPERPDPTRQGADVLERTVALIQDAGYAPDPGLWMLPADGRIPVTAGCGHSPKCAIKPIPRPKPPSGIDAQ